MKFSDKDKIKLAGRIGWFAAIFSMAMSVLLIANFLQTKLNDPINNKTIPALVKRLSQNPADENLKAEIRAFDLMARKAYFTSQIQIRTGSYLLILGVLITILSVRSIASFTSKLAEIDHIEHVNGLDELMARKWVIYSGSGLLLLSLISGFLSSNLLSAYQTEESTAPKEELIASNTALSNQNLQIVAPEATAKSTISPEIQKVKLADSASLKTNPPPSEQVQPPSVSAYPTQAELKSNFPYFRGAEGIGISYQKNSLTDWNGTNGKNLIWKVKIPKPGFSSPIVWGNKLFVTGADAQARMVYCYDAKSGQLIWEASADKIEGSPAGMPKVTSDTGLAAPTMATDGRAVFAIFATGDVIALDLSGKRLWARNLGMPDNHYGHASSLIISKDKLLVQYDTNKAGKLIALSTQTGETKWETLRKSRIAWSSPALVNTGSRMEVILSTNPNVSSYNPETGKELWSVDCLSGEVGPSVGYSDGMVFAANEYAKLVGIKLGPTPEIAWESDEFLPEVSSPLAVKGLLFIATSYGVFACFDAKTGKKYWSQEFGDPFYASAVYADGKVYITDMSGKTHIVKATKEYQLIGTPELGEKAVCSPVFTDGKVYIRGMNQLFCFGSK
ncbi:MAG: PQQ-binding-like beta-propeller repeat protein [Prolixibacteraceae bacterium]